MKQRIHKTLINTLILTPIILSLAIFILGQLNKASSRTDKFKYGFSFSKTRAIEMGFTDWRVLYNQILNDLKPDHLRLMSYWDKNEPKNDSFAFEDLDWQIQQAAKHGVKVDLSIGLRQPRWPECHQPSWAKQLYQDDKALWNNELEEYINTVISRYDKYQNIKSYQLENEYFNKNFGECDDFSRERLISEFELVKKLSDKPITLAYSDQFGLSFKQPMPDIYATSLYRSNAGSSLLGNFPYPIPAEYYGTKAIITRLVANRPTKIHELQLEPWARPSENILEKNIAEKYMPAKKIQKNIQFAKKTGIKEIDMWGVEWWYARKQAGDNSVLNAVKAELN